MQQRNQNGGDEVEDHGVPANGVMNQSRVIGAQGRWKERLSLNQAPKRAGIARRGKGLDLKLDRPS
ncbi:DUF1998 domain-containing protein [Sesbania bispinosa]|nr:DUF1998 domain-containing protein [Sesbania bispinosa]